ncbi:MAG: hypothetical protein ACRD3V_09005, partial [Vicinamibacteria bacterium]
VPLYAPASGEIASCWRNFPDDPQPGVNPPNNDQIFTGGNHVVIITDEGNAISLNHFKSGTIPASLCPSNPGAGQFPSTMDKEGDWRVAAFIDAADRPRVREGDFLGRVGNSGKSGGPHLHISRHRVINTPLNGREVLAASSSPLKFRHGWGHRFEVGQQHTSGGWYRLRGGNFTGDPGCPAWQANSPGCGFKTLHPSPYLRRADAVAGEIRESATLFLHGNRAVTATVAESNQHLKLIAWDLVGVDSIVRRGNIESGPAKQVFLSEPLNDHVLAAVRQSNDLLSMIAYRVTPTGNFMQVDEYVAGEIVALDMATTVGGDRKSVTAVRDSNGNLKLIVWDIKLSNGGIATIERHGERVAGSVSALAISYAKNFKGVFTAVRDANNELRVIPWRMSDDGETLTRGQHVVAGAIGTHLAVAPLAQGVAAGVQDSDGKLRLITWSVSASGNIGQRRSTGIAGPASDIGLLRAPLGDSNLTSVVRGGDDRLYLIGWAVDGDGRGLRRLGSSRAGGASRISADVTARTYAGLDPRDMILTTLRDENGRLKLITWDTNLVNP